MLNFDFKTTTVKNLTIVILILFCTSFAFGQTGTNIGNNSPLEVDSFSCTPAVVQTFGITHFNIDQDNWFINNAGFKPCPVIPQNPDEDYIFVNDGVTWDISNMDLAGLCTGESAGFQLIPTSSCVPDSVVLKISIPYATTVNPEDNNEIEVIIWDGTNPITSSLVMWPNNQGMFTSVSWSGAEAAILANNAILIGWDVQGSENSISYMEIDFIEIQYYGVDCDYHSGPATPVSLQNIGECAQDYLNGKHEDLMNALSLQTSALYNVLEEMQKQDTIKIIDKFSYTNILGECFVGEYCRIIWDGVVIDSFVNDILGVTSQFTYEPTDLTFQPCGCCVAPVSSVIEIQSIEVPTSCLDVHSYSIVAARPLGPVARGAETVSKSISDIQRLLAVDVSFILTDLSTGDIYTMTLSSPSPDVSFVLAGSAIRVQLQGPATADVTFTVVDNLGQTPSQFVASFTVIDLDGAPSNERMTATNDEFCSITNGGTTSLVDNGDGTTTVTGTGLGGVTANFIGIIDGSITTITYATDIGLRFFDHDMTTAVPPVTDYVVSGFNATSTLDTPDNITYNISNDIGGKFYLISSGLNITSFSQQDVDDRLIGFQVTGASGSTLSYDVTVSDNLGGLASQSFSMTIP